ncbi:MAG: hypothetical protein JSV19_04510 [Phycisphaerales bacterium]|nr:MAG: hypothetical protein JSV19_04510 [Phycisphaerales bacterium]
MNGVYCTRIASPVCLTVVVLALAPAPALSDMMISDPALGTGSATLADAFVITDPSEIIGPTRVIGFEVERFSGLITDPNILIGEGIIFPDAPQGEFIRTELNLPNDNAWVEVSDGWVRIDFVDPVRAAGIEFEAGAGPLQDMTFVANNEAGNLIGYTTRTGEGFFGIDGGGALIGSILIHDDAGSFNIDNLVLSAQIPVPAAVVLGATGLGLVVWVKRRLS